MREADPPGLRAQAYHASSEEIHAKELVCALTTFRTGKVYQLGLGRRQQSGRSDVFSENLLFKAIVTLSARYHRRQLIADCAKERCRKRLDRPFQMKSE